ncbi:MAG: hypothetical protein II773_07100 [Oscillospiraceae bacterium]|nr:hypothetical protein [Oscillospiraceae bacterium]MBQ4311338.1 hypothetical protein [Oscillospiraceae bacterium]
MNKFRDKLIQFMYGRYGADELYKFMTAVLLILLIVNIFAKSLVIGLLIAVIIVIVYFRVLSRNTEQRRKENYAFVQLAGKVKHFFHINRLRVRDRKDHVYRRCPECKKTLRLPRRKGQHTVCCPQCKKTFKVKI